MRTSESNIKECTYAQFKPFKTTTHLLNLSVKYVWISTLLLVGFFLSTSYVSEENAMYDFKNEFYSLEMHQGISQRLSINSSLLFAEQPHLKAQELIKEFYKENEFNSIWTINQNLNAAAVQVLQLLDNASHYGLDRKTYHYEKLIWLSENIKKVSRTDSVLMFRQDFEILLTDACFLFMLHLNKGIISLDSTVKEHAVRDISEYLYKGIKNDNLLEKVLALQPHNRSYRNLQRALERFVDGNIINDVSIEIPDPEKDSMMSYTNAKLVLNSLGYLTSDLIENESTFHAALLEFQKYHGLKPDGKLNKNTRKAMSMTTRERFLMAALALDKIRKEVDFGDDFIFVNIPAYQLRVIRGSKLDRTFNVVVGRPSTPTPELSSKLETIVTAPEWNVPKTISMNEILPHAKKDSSYLIRNNFKVIDKQLNEVDINKIGWESITSENFDYYFVQNSGISNALGLLKFSFNNPYRVYIHDTPSKKYFNEDIRAYSHGCVRLQNPDLLASYLVENNLDTELKPDIGKLIEKRIHQDIKLSKPIDIYIRYLTCEADEDLNLYFYKDIYNKDVTSIKLLLN